MPTSLAWATAYDSGQVPGPGEKFKTSELATPALSGGLLVPEYRKQLRKPNEFVTVLGLVAGHGGDYVWCSNTDSTVAPYALTELLYLDPVGDDFVI